MIVNKLDTALVVIDPQNDVLSERGVSWGLVGESIKENNTVENIARLLQAAKEKDYGVFISPHYLYPADQAWRFVHPRRERARCHPQDQDRGGDGDCGRSQQHHHINKLRLLHLAQRFRVDRPRHVRRPFGQLSAPSC